LEMNLVAELCIVPLLLVEFLFKVGLMNLGIGSKFDWL